MSSSTNPGVDSTTSDDLTDAPEADICILLPNETRLSGKGYKHGLRDHPSFCWVCTNFDRAVAEELYGLDLERGLHLDKFSNGVTANARYEDIADAAENGCSSCVLLRDSLVAFKGVDLFEQPQSGEVTVTYLEGTTMIVAMLDEYGNETDSLEFFTDPDAPCPWPTIGPLVHTIYPYMSTSPWPGGLAKRVPRDPNSTESYETVKRWIANCKREHEWCDPQSTWHAENPVSSSQMPQRLIHVGNDNWALRLCDKEEWGYVPTYLALSYCWGSSRGLVALQSNIAGLKTSIPFERLAKTCQDAVTITRQLGFQFVWIDSICIIQDSSDDWQTQSALMGSTYTNAYLCIAATAARSSETGIFRPRDRTKVVSLTDVQGRQSCLYVRNEIRHGVFDWRTSDPTGNQFGSSEAARDHYPLFKRGWAFQERLLSRRILHYTHSEMIWECLGSTSCECGTMDDYAGSGILQERRYVASIPRDIEIRCNRLDRAKRLARRYGYHRLEDYRVTPLNSINSAMRRDFTLWLLLSGGATDTEDENEQVRDRWHDTVAEYSRRALTFATDALPALSGLARKWSTLNELPNVYLAGLWRNTLQRDLLWKYRDTIHADRPIQYLAPTWSWAANRRAVEWIKASHDSIYQTSVLHAICESSGSNMFGAVKDGEIKLRGPTLEGRIKVTYNLKQSSFALVTFGEHKRQPRYEHQFYVDCIPECARLEGSTATVIWLCTDTQDTTTLQGVDRGLVLIEKTRSESQVFSRIGVMERMDADALIGWQETTLTIV